LERLVQLREAYAQLSAWEASLLETQLKELAVKRGCKPAEYIHPARVAVSGRSIGPSLYHMLEVLGQQRVVARIDRTLAEFAG
jgi:glutamyl-tRNA synthetase